MAIRKTTQQFISKAKNIHGDKYDYSLVEYITSRIKVNIICRIHGEFEQLPRLHLSGNGCNACGIESQKHKMSYSLEQFISKSKHIHNNKYDYSLVTEYVNGETKIPIICTSHGMWYQKPSLHLKGLTTSLKYSTGTP